MNSCINLWNVRNIIFTGSAKHDKQSIKMSQNSFVKTNNRRENFFFKPKRTRSFRALSSTTLRKSLTQQKKRKLQRIANKLQAYYLPETIEPASCCLGLKISHTYTSWGPIEGSSWNRNLKENLARVVFKGVF